MSASTRIIHDGFDLGAYALAFWCFSRFGHGASFARALALAADLSGYGFRVHREEQSRSTVPARGWLVFPAECPGW